MIHPDTRAVFFDAVGTLLFPVAPVHETYAVIGGRHGHAPPDGDGRLAFQDAFARQERRDFQDGWRTDEARERARWRAIVGEVLPGPNADGCFADLWAWFSTPEAWAPHPEAADVLAELAGRGLTVGVASNFDARLVGLVDALPDLAPLRGQCVVSSLVGWRKPAREFFQAVQLAAGCPAEQVLYVGDDVRNDIHGATAAGLRAVLFDPDGKAEGGPRIRRLRDLLPA